MSNATDGNDAAATDLTADELEGVAGGAFHTELQPGEPIAEGGGHAFKPVGISEACLNPQPLPP